MFVSQHPVVVRVVTGDNRASEPTKTTLSVSVGCVFFYKRRKKATAKKKKKKNKWGEGLERNRARNRLSGPPTTARIYWPFSTHTEMQPLQFVAEELTVTMAKLSLL